MNEQGRPRRKKKRSRKNRDMITPLDTIMRILAVRENDPDREIDTAIVPGPDLEIGTGVEVAEGIEDRNNQVLSATAVLRPSQPF